MPGLMEENVPRFRSCAAAAILLAACGVLISASEAGDTSVYFHALADLRHARACLSRTQAGNIQQRVQVEDQHAIAEIDQALWEIKNASIDDGRDINDHPAINAHMARSARLHQSRSLLEKVHQNVASSEDSFPSGLRDRVLQHVDQAHRILDRIINQGVAD